MKFSDQVLAYPMGLFAFNVYSFIFSRLGDFETFEANYVDALMAIGYIFGLVFFLAVFLYFTVVLMYQRPCFISFMNIIIPNIVFWRSMVKFVVMCIITSVILIYVIVIIYLDTKRNDIIENPIKWEAMGWKAIVMLLIFWNISDCCNY